MRPNADQGPSGEAENRGADDELGRLLLGVEAKAHRDGWDRPPQLHALTRRADQPIAATPLFPAGREPVAPHVLLEATRIVAESDLFAARLRPRLGTGFCGFLMVLKDGREPVSTPSSPAPAARWSTSPARGNAGRPFCAPPTATNRPSYEFAASSRP
ncbi:hypothetical protein [Actinokineospora iranica]|uniref:Uncharacterized protein n=1 Tax=Actinokineospora iranica TaxID=1271860 RepID=A0A1G6ZHN4_9PSEU|nr:hypothetical protein [Actinokineospora iranica]SDE02159.1 hypothetical protein SAMN05216174_1332 [Actinokineospora iranica]